MSAVVTDARPLRLGTRASVLARTQSQWVADRLQAAIGREVELVPIVSHGDVLTGSLASLGGTGVFATALRESLRAGECDFVVHSMKDLPTGPYPDLTIASVPERERPHDTLCADATLSELPSGARIGTGSPRRVAQILRARPDVEVHEIRGNVDTRLGLVRSGAFDAVVLAEAGLRRIDRTDAIAQVFDLEHTPTSAGQGALAIECRDSDEEMIRLLRTIDDPQSHRSALAERAVLARLEAGCAAPVGVSVIERSGVTILTAEVYALDGQRSIRAEAALDTLGHDDAVAVVVAELLAQGAAEIAPLSPGSLSRG